MPRVVTAGESMALLTPVVPGRLRHAAQLHLRAAGTESNVAIALQRLGIASGWISRLGEDELGQLILDRVRAEGVDTSEVSRSATRTGLYFRDSVAAGVRVYYYREGSAASELDAGICDPDYLRGAEYVHITGVTPALSPACERFNRWVAAQARARGVRVSFDVNYRSRLWPPEAARAFTESFLADVDLIFVSEDDARALWGDASEALAQKLAGGRERDVVITLGARGAVASIGGRIVASDGFAVNPIDVVGCGDAFAAGYLAAALWDETPSRRLKIANAMGAYNALSHGDYEGLPSTAELFVFLEGGVKMTR